MSQISSPPSISASPIQAILLVAKFERRSARHQFQATSLPGHLLQLMTAGEVHQGCNGREYELRPGNLIWYHEDELVQGATRRVPWVFYSVNFIAPTLSPPPFDARLFPDCGSLRPLFAELSRAWLDVKQTPSTRGFQAHAALLRILASLDRPARRPYQVDPRAQLWWELEAECRKDPRRPISLAIMAERAHSSPATIARSCLYAVGLPPLKRLKQVRLSLARGLVLRSQFSMKEIAEQIGFPRIHEFSRDYRKHFGLPPTADRLRGSSM